MSRKMLIGLTLALLLPAGAPAQIPPGYEVVQVTQSPYHDFRPRINSSGQIVFTRWFDTSDRSTEEIYLYDDGELIRLTNDNIQDVGPDISAEGIVVWARGLAVRRRSAFWRRSGRVGEFGCRRRWSGQ